MNHDEFASALGKVPSGLYIATGLLEGKRVGMLCSFVEQASFQPPMLTIALGPDRLVARALDENGKVALNILSEHNQSVIKPFANPSNEDPFAETYPREGKYGLPVLPQCLAVLFGEKRGQLRAGDHTVYLVEITHGELFDPSGTPMIRVRKNGLKY